MSPLAAILQSYRAEDKENNLVDHSVKKNGSFPSLHFDEVIVRVPTASNDPGSICHSALLYNEILAQTPNLKIEEDTGMPTKAQARPISALFGFKTRSFTDKFTFGFANRESSQLSTSYPNMSSGFMFYKEGEVKGALNLRETDMSRNPSSSSSMSSTNTVVSSIPVSNSYLNHHKAIEQSQLSQIHNDNDLYSLVEQDLRFTPALYKISPFAISPEAAIEDDKQSAWPHSVCPWQLQSNKINYSQPSPIHLKLKRGLLENIQDVFNQTIEEDGDDAGIVCLETQDGATVQDCIMGMSAPTSTSPQRYALSRMASPQMKKLSMFKFTTSPAPAEAFETPVAPETTPVSDGNISIDGSPFAVATGSDNRAHQIASSDTKVSPESTWRNSVSFFNGTTSGVDPTNLGRFKKAFFASYSKLSIIKVKMTESDRKLFSKEDPENSKASYFTMVDRLDCLTCSTFVYGRKFNCPVKECPMYFLGIKKKAELKHHVHYQHLKNGLVKSNCRAYARQIKEILFVCIEADCGKAFYRCDSLSRHRNLVHGNRGKRGVKRKLVVHNDDVVDDESVTSYEGDSELENPIIVDSEACSTVTKRRKSDIK
ncbi:RME1 [Candida margitis]|uniref:RME1 n=1 Tax=Candida margitis TaxID=1775924 RepID=UPI0022279955|nr:RME1 [Candida margitis]KAI5953927.1 RME1 [Candida margitis]